MRVATFVLGFTFAGCCAFAGTPKWLKPLCTVQRGQKITIETEFESKVEIQAAFLTWQTFKLDKQIEQYVCDLKDSAKQTGLATAFICSADVARNGAAVSMSCKVPLDVADEHYYLTSVLVETSGHETRYGFQDLPTEVQVCIKGGQQISPSKIKSIELK